jgi:hypothetical protein
MVRKKPYGSLNHGDKQIGSSHINDLFEDPPAFMRALVSGGYIVPGSIEASSFFKLTSFNGPMYKVFNDDELEIWKNWVVWLGRTTPPVPLESDPAKLMAACIDLLRARQQGTPEHAQRTLTGPDPANPKQTVTQSVAKWFGAPTGIFMAALSDPTNGWIVKGEPAKSRFVTDLLGGDNMMSRAFDSVVPNSGERTGKQIVSEWISKGCPLPPAPPALRSRAQQLSVARPQRLTLTSTVREVQAHPRRRVLGMGCVH